MVHYIETPLTTEKVEKLEAGDKVFISGIIYTSRDAGHKKMIDQLKNEGTLPFNIEGNIIYYVGPSPTKPDGIIGSAGPTTSYRMDAYTPTLLDCGLKGMIGKGERNEEVIESMIKNKAVYFGAVGGAAVLIASAIKKVELIAFEELGPEALRKLTVENFPVTVVIDSKGNNLYVSEKAKYRKGNAE